MEQEIFIETTFGSLAPGRLESEVNYMQSLGYNVTYREYEGIAHEFTATMKNDLFQFFADVINFGSNATPRSSQPMPTIISGSATPTPTPSPTPTPQFTARTPSPAATTQPVTPTPTSSRESNVFIYDNASDTSDDLSGQTDFDAVDARNLSILSIAWDAEQGNAADWHIYVRKGFGGAKFLGRTASGSATHFNWYSGADNLESAFANGPDFNSVYTFCVVRLDGRLGPDDFFKSSAPVGFNMEGGNSVSLARPELPNLRVNQIVIYDDILGGNDLAPMHSSGTDSDSLNSRAIQIAWNFGRDPSTVNEYHVFISVDGADLTYLGQTHDGDTNYYWWTPNREFRVHSNFADGPQNGQTYQFRVFLIPLSGNQANLTSGILHYYSVSD